MTTTALSLVSMLWQSRSSIRQPSGVQGTIAARSVPSRPTFEMWKRGHPWPRAMASTTAAAPI